MKLEHDNTYTRIKGDNFGDKRHIKIYVSSENGLDYFSLSIVKDGIEYGCLPSVHIYKEDIVIQNNLERGRQILK